MSDDMCILRVMLIDQRRKTEHPITEIMLGKPLVDDLRPETRQSLEQSVDIKAAEPVPSMPRYWLHSPGPGLVLGEEEFGDEGPEGGEGEVDSEDEDDVEANEGPRARPFFAAAAAADGERVR